MQINFQKIIRQYWPMMAVVAIAAAFFCLTASFNYIVQSYATDKKDIDFVKWSSPDETANYTFAKLYAQTGELMIFEKHNLYASDIIRPRSLRSDHGFLKPVSFLGIILIYGQIASYFGYKVIPFLTPLIAAIGIVYYFKFVRRLFGKSAALSSAFLLASFPVYAYYTARSMFHNVLLTVLVMIGLYYGYLMATTALKKRDDDRFRHLRANWLGMLFAALSGVFLGLAVITRSSEIIWIVPLLLLLWLINIKQIGLVKLMVFLSFMFLGILPALCHNQYLYGNPLFGGYPEMNQTIMNIGSVGADISSAAVLKPSAVWQKMTTVKDNVFHFGIHPRQSFRMLYFYLVRMFPWIFWTAVVGFIFLVIKIKRWRRKHWAYIFSLLMISVILVIYYGSWEFHDNPDPNSFTIGNSYTRYWLPIYLGILPFAAMFIVKITEAVCSLFFWQSDRNIVNGEFFSMAVRRKFMRGALRAVLLLAVFFLSARFLLIGSEEGFVYARQNFINSRYEWEQVLSYTPSDSVIITRYHDKIFFPERKVILGDFTDPNMNLIYAGLINRLPVYYYNFTFPEKDFNWLNQDKLKGFGMKIVKVRKITKDFTLYQLKKAD